MILLSNNHKIKKNINYPYLAHNKINKTPPPLLCCYCSLIIFISLFPIPRIPACIQIDYYVVLYWCVASLGPIIASRGDMSPHSMPVDLRLLWGISGEDFADYGSWINEANTVACSKAFFSGAGV